MLDVIIVSYNHERFMDGLFRALAKVNFNKNDWRIKVVINKPGDGTKETVLRLIGELHFDLPQTVILEPGQNLGFAGGNNLAIEAARREGTEYVFMLNPDTEPEPDFLVEAITAAKSTDRIGAVQSLLLRGDQPDKLNSRGNALHYLGFGYCMGDLEPRGKAPQIVTDIGYPSGAAMLVPMRVIEKIGMFDEMLFLYHEDLEWGWRMRLAGYNLVLAPKSVVVHHYEFSKSIAKWEFMERNRLLVLLKCYKLLTLIAISPALMATEAAMLALSVKNGWLMKKIRADLFLLKPSTWRYLLAGREKISRLRVVSDAYCMVFMTYKIEYQEMREGWAEKIANPFWGMMYASLRFIIRW